jgi:hypothetical protein
MSQSVERGDDINAEYLQSVVRDKLVPAVKQIIQTGVAPDVDEKDKIGKAVETYNEEPFVRFRYPSAYAKLATDKDNKYVFKGAFTTYEKSNITLEAVFAMLATRQALAGSQFFYPMTLFLGPDIKKKEVPKAKRLARFSRVVFGDLGSDNPYTAMASFTPSYPRRAHVVVWIQGSNEGPAEKPGRVGTIVNKWWYDHMVLRGYEKLANADILERDLSSEYIRNTGSTDVHSLLWPIIKLSMTTNELKLYYKLGTTAAVGIDLEGKNIWDESTGGFISTPWHRWTMGLLAYGSIPYKKHSDTDPLPWYGQHMTKGKLIELAKTVKINEAK